MSDEACLSCGHIRYKDDPFNGNCEVCCEWIRRQLAQCQRERDEAIAGCHEWEQREIDLVAKLERIRAAAGEWRGANNRTGSYGFGAAWRQIDAALFNQFDAEFGKDGW